MIGRPFQRGTSGNPGGRPKAAHSIQELARKHTIEAVDVLVQIMLNEKAPPNSRVAAANTLLDRAYGKAPTFSTSDTQVFKRAIDMSDDELAAIVAGAKLTLVKRGEIAPTVNGTPRTRGTPMRMRLEKWFESHSPIGLVER